MGHRHREKNISSAPPKPFLLGKQDFLLLLKCKELELNAPNTAIHCLRDGKKGISFSDKAQKLLRITPTLLSSFAGVAKLEGEKVAVYLIPSSLLLDLSLHEAGPAFVWPRL